MPRLSTLQSLVLSSPTGPQFGRTLGAKERTGLWRIGRVSIASAACAITRVDLQTSHALCFGCDRSWYEVFTRGANGDVFGRGGGCKRGQQSGARSCGKGREVGRGVEVDEGHGGGVRGRFCGSGIGEERQEIADQSV